MKNNILAGPLAFAAVGVCLAACSSSASSTGYQIVAADDGALTAVAGDARSLKVVEGFSDHTQQDLPNGAVVAWTTPVTASALDVDSTDDSPIPAFGAAPTAIFIDNSFRDSNLAGVLFVVDAGTASGGTATVSASVTGAVTATATATISVAATPAGVASHGATLYAAACASCHGATGAGSPPDANGTTYTLEGIAYTFPAPGLNTAPGNVASDPSWTVGVFAMSARADIDDGGVLLRGPMPDWMTTTVGGKLLTTQDFADIYAFLQTQ